MYKKNYIIGVYSYDKYELCETILETPTEFARYVGIDIELARVILSKLFHHKSNYIIVNGKRKNIEFINIKENE